MTGQNQQSLILLLHNLFYYYLLKQNQNYVARQILLKWGLDVV